MNPIARASDIIPLCPSSATGSETTTSIKAIPSYRVCFGLLLACGFLMRLACFTGLIGSDDVGYSRFAQLIAQLNYKPQLHHFALRYGLILPVGFLYRTFGVEEWTTILLPLLASTASVAAVMLGAEKLFNQSTALLAGVLMATFPLELRYATILVPEPIAEFYVLLAIVAYLYWGTKRPALAGLFSGVGIGVAYVTKESALFVAPALVIDAVATRKWRAVVGVLLGLLMIAGIEHAYYVAATGDLLFRPHAMVHHNESPAAVDANQHLRPRLFKEYPKMMLVPTLHFGLHSLFAILGTLGACLMLSGQRLRFLILWAALPLLYLNFGTSNLDHYWALPAVDRYLLFVYPPLFMLCAEVLIRLAAVRPRTRPYLGAAFLLIVVVGFVCGFCNRAEGWRTNAVKKLRIIGAKAKHDNLHTVSVNGPAGSLWCETLRILDHNLQPSKDSQEADITITPDMVDLPKVSVIRDGDAVRK